MTLPSGGIVVFDDVNMPSIIELLEQQEFAYSILEVAGTPMARRERRAWVLLVALAFIWGGLTVASFTSTSALLHPVTATMGLLCIAVLVLVVVLFGRQADKRPA